MANEDPGPIEDESLFEGMVGSDLHLDVDVGAVSETHEEVEDRALVAQFAGVDVGIEHLDVSDGRGRTEHRGEELEQEWSVFLGSEEELEDDVGLRVEVFFGWPEIVACGDGDRARPEAG